MQYFPKVQVLLFAFICTSINAKYVDDVIVSPGDAHAYAPETGKIDIHHKRFGLPQWGPSRAACSCNGKLYVSHENSITVWDNETDTSEKFEHVMKESRQFNLMECVNNGKHILMCGGVDRHSGMQDTSKSSCELCDITLNRPKCQYVSDMPIHMTGIISVAANDHQVIVVSSHQMTENNNFNFVTVVYSYDSKKDQWTELPALKEARQNTAVTMLNSHTVLICGGVVAPFNPKEIVMTNTCETLDLNDPNNVWESVASMNQPRGYHVLERMSNGLVYALGGFNNRLRDSLTSVEVLDPVTMKWTLSRYQMWETWPVNLEAAVRLIH